MNELKINNFQKFSQTSLKVKGFTLAEVQITLTVIGIIAALVIPIFAHNAEEAAYRSQLKSIYTRLSQVTKIIMAGNRGTMLNLCGPAGSNTEADGTCFNANSNEYVAGLYKKHLKYLRSCSTWDAETGECWYAEKMKSYSPNSDWSEDYPGGSRIVLSNGMLLGIVYHDGGCNDTGRCGYIRVDVNGKRGPNRWGYDIYVLNIMEDKILPGGVRKFFGWCVPDGLGGFGTGYGCAIERLRE